MFSDMVTCRREYVQVLSFKLKPKIEMVKFEYRQRIVGDTDWY